MRPPGEGGREQVGWSLVKALREVSKEANYIRVIIKRMRRYKLIHRRGSAEKRVYKDSWCETGFFIKGLISRISDPFATPLIRCFSQPASECHLGSLPLSPFFVSLSHFLSLPAFAWPYNFISTLRMENP